MSLEMKLAVGRRLGRSGMTPAGFTVAPRAPSLPVKEPKFAAPGFREEEQPVRAPFIRDEPERPVPAHVMPSVMPGGAINGRGVQER